MPCHEVIGTVVSQFSEAVPRRVSLAARSVSQSAIRLVDSLGLVPGIATVLAHEVVCAITGVGALPMVNIKVVMVNALPRTMRAAREIPRVGRIYLEHLYGG